MVSRNYNDNINVGILSPVVWSVRGPLCPFTPSLHPVKGTDIAHYYNIRMRNVIGVYYTYLIEISCNLWTIVLCTLSLTCHMMIID